MWLCLYVCLFWWSKRKKRQFTYVWMCVLVHWQKCAQARAESGIQTLGSMFSSIEDLFLWIIAYNSYVPYWPQWHFPLLNFNQVCQESSHRALKNESPAMLYYHEGSGMPAEPTPRPPDLPECSRACWPTPRLAATTSLLVGAWDMGGRREDVTTT